MANKQKSLTKVGLAGGIAGSMEIAVTYPLEYVKTNVQLQHGAAGNEQHDYLVPVWSEIIRWRVHDFVTRARKIEGRPPIRVSYFRISTARQQPANECHVAAVISRRMRDQRQQRVA